MPSSDVCSRSEEHTSELQSHDNLVCRLLLEKKDRKSTRLNSSHTIISYAVFCLKKKKKYPSRSALLLTAASAPRPRRARAVAGEGCVRRRPRRSSACRRSAWDFGVFFFNDRGPPKISTLSLPDPFPF